MKPSKIFIVRHGVSLSNLDESVHYTTPDWKIDMHPRGEKQCKRAAETILASCLAEQDYGGSRFAVYTSPYYRTRQTWQAIKKHLTKKKKDLLDQTIVFEREDPRLREQEWGGPRADRNGAFIEMERENYGGFYYRFLNGESGADVYDRCAAFWETMYREFQRESFPDNLIIVTHSFTLRCLVMSLLNRSPEEFQTWKHPDNGTVVEIKTYSEYCNEYYLVKEMELK